MQAKKQDIKKAYKEANCQETKDTLKRLYPKVEFEKKLADSWGEYCEMTKCTFVEMNEHHISGNNHTVFIGPQVGNMVIDATYRGNTSKYTALRKLELLRDHYNDRVNYCDRYDVISIVNKMGNIKIELNPTSDNFLSFKDTETAEKFFLNFKYLIEQAEDLI